MMFVIICLMLLPLAQSGSSVVDAGSSTSSYKTTMEPSAELSMDFTTRAPPCKPANSTNDNSTDSATGLPCTRKPAKPQKSRGKGSKPPIFNWPSAIDKLNYDCGNCKNDACRMVCTTKGEGNMFWYVDTTEFAISVTIYGLTFALGVSGNSLVIFSIIKHLKTKDVTNVFLLSLACADLLLLLISLPFKIYESFIADWLAGNAMCKIFNYARQVSFTCSVLTLTTMALERYTAICHPLKALYSCTVGRARKMAIGVWILSFVLAIPTLIIYMAQTTEGNQRKCRPVLPPLTVYETLYHFYWLCILYALPLSVMAFAYGRVCYTLWSSVKKSKDLHADTGPRSSHSGKVFVGGQSHSHPNGFTRASGQRPMARADDSADRRKVIKMLITVVLIFSLCWGPYLIARVLESFNILEKLSAIHNRFDNLLMLSFSLLAYFNSCVNPIIYCFMSRKFRQSFISSVSCCRRHRRRKSLCASGTLMTISSATTSGSTRISSMPNSESSLSKISDTSKNLVV